MEDGSNLGWWVPALVVAIPLLFMLSLHLLARLEHWMFAPDERAAKVATLLSEVDGPDEVEAEVTRLLADVRTPSPNGRRVNGSAPSGQRRGARLRRPVAQVPAAPAGEEHEE